VRRANQLHEHLKELLFKVLIRGRESLEQDATCPADQGMPTDQLRWMRGVEVKKA